MKTIVSKELRYRLTNAAANGSIIAKDILVELKKNADVCDIIRGCANHFATKRKKQEGSGCQKVRIVFTVCTKDITNSNFPDRDNPQAPWFSENRTEIEPSTFIKYFKNLPEYEQEDIDYFINSICVNSKVSVRIYDKMSDFYDAYLAENYTTIAQFGDSSLHSSCMRYENTSRNTADFYFNFAGAKIIIARDSEKNILGRAIVWEHVNYKRNNPDLEIELSVLDRVYYSHTFIVKLINDYAQSIGIHLRKKHNDYSSTESFVVLNDINELCILKGDAFHSSNLTIHVPATKWHKKGAPYLDTFYAASLSGEGKIYLKNSEDSYCFATCRETSGFAAHRRNVCPVCAVVHSSDYELCPECKSKYCAQTPFGLAFLCKVAKYDGNIYPGFLFEKGKPSQHLKLYLQTNKLYH